MSTSHSRLVLTLLLVFIAQLVVSHPASIWEVHIYRDPAPPPDEGPPLSASAERDISLLWRDIVSIVAAYIGSVLILLGGLLTIGRRLRRNIQQSNQTLEMEIIKPSRHQPNVLHSPTSLNGHMITPVSGTESQTWSPKRRKSSFHLPWQSNSRGPASPTSQDGSVATVDESVVQADRMRAQEEMERLYAAVLEHDAKQSTVIYDESHNGQLPSPANSPKARSPVTMPPEFQHLRHPRSPRSPRSPQHEPHPAPALQHRPHPINTSRGEPSPRQPTSPLSPISNKLSRLSTLSFLSSRSKSSSTTPNKLRRPSVRNLPISSPMSSPESAGYAYSDSQPLTPRHYTPGPPPLNPHQLENRSLPPSPDDPSRNSFRTAGSSTSVLPFRAINPPQSAPPTKTTIVERRESLIRPHGPRTGIPHTPYSPYMPFTPITPMTPSKVVTRRERKQKEKEQGMRVLAEDDLVKSDDEVWGTDA